MRELHFYRLFLSDAGFTQFSTLFGRIFPFTKAITIGKIRTWKSWRKFRKWNRVDLPSKCEHHFPATSRKSVFSIRIFGNSLRNLNVRQRNRFKSPERFSWYSLSHEIHLYAYRIDLNLCICYTFKHTSIIIHCRRKNFDHHNRVCKCSLGL